MPDQAEGTPKTVSYPADPSAAEVREDFSHLRFARGYVLHDAGLEPDVPGFWRIHDVAGRTLRWDPRIGAVHVSSEGYEVLICGVALDPELRTMELSRIAENLLHQRVQSRQDYLDALERMFGQYVVLDSDGDSAKIQSDAIGSRSIFHDESGRVVASHVNLVGVTLGRPKSKFVKWVGRTRNNDFPGRTTPFEGVWLLTPNTELSLGVGDITRIGPRPYEPLSVDQAADRMLSLLQTQAEVLLGSGRQVVISASAGVDSRTSLAAFSGKNGAKDVQVFTYTKGPGTGRQSRELHRDKLASTMASDLGMPHVMFDLNEAERPPKEFLNVLDELSPRRSNTVISWGCHRLLPHDSLHIRGQINGVGKWHFAQRLHVSESVELSARRMASLTKRGKDVEKPLSDPWWELGEEGFQEYIDTTKLRSVPVGYRLTDLFLWEHRVANWNHSHIVESDVTFDTYQLFGSREMIRLMLSVPEIDRAQLSLFRELIRRQEPSLLEYPLNGKPWKEPRKDLPLSSFQQGGDTSKELESLRQKLEEKQKLAQQRKSRLIALTKKLRQLEDG